MGGRFDRLRGPQEFIRGLATKPVAASGPFLIHRIENKGPARLGLVVPKRWVKQAVRRNQVKRWAREMLNQSTLSDSSYDVIVRVRRGLGVPGWSAGDRLRVRNELKVALIEAGFLQA